MISLKPVIFDASYVSTLDYEDLDDLVVGNPQSPLMQLALDVIDKLNHLDAFTQANNCLHSDHYDDDEVGHEMVDLKQQDVEIEVILIDNKEVIDLWDAPEESIGLFAINGGPIEEDLSQAFRVVVNLDESLFRAHIKEVRKRQRNPDYNCYDRDCLNMFLNTITHELAHAKEWIEGTNGLTPYQYMDCVERGVVDFSMEDICLGNGTLYEHIELGDNCDLYDDMYEEAELRVEEQGAKWLNGIKMDAQKVEACLKHYAPQRDRFNVERSF